MTTAVLLLQKIDESGALIPVSGSDKSRPFTKREWEELRARVDLAYAIPGLIEEAALQGLETFLREGAADGR